MADKNPRSGEVPQHDDYDARKSQPGPMSKEAMDQMEATCGKVPKSKGGTGPN